MSLPQSQSAPHDKCLTFPVPTPINEKVYDLLKLYCLGAIETSPDGEALYNEVADLIEKIDTKAPANARSVASEISDMLMEIACHYGEEMFKLGILIGRDPSAIFDLPDDN